MAFQSSSFRTLFARGVHTFKSVHYPTTRQSIPFHLNTSPNRPIHIHVNRYFNVTTPQSSGMTASEDTQLINDVITYWYGGTDFESRRLDSMKEMSTRWYTGGEAVDTEIREKFGSSVEKAIDGQLDHLINNNIHGIKGDLALTLLLDQYSRNMYRGSEKAFSGDVKSKTIAMSVLQPERWIIAKRELPYLVRVSFLMSLMHQEFLPDQDRCYNEIEKLIVELEEDHKDEDDKESLKECSDVLQSTLMYSAKHRDIIVKFSRFPHRNYALGRISTEEELEYLKNGDRFGQ